MFARLTSKGQLTLRKQIRDRSSLDAGAISDLPIQADNTITDRHVQPDARPVRGSFKSPHAAPLAIEQTEQAVATHLRNSHAPGRAGRKSAVRSDQPGTVRPRAAGER